MEQRYRRVAFGVLALVAVGLSVALMMPFVPALLWATVLSILMYPLYVKWKAACDRKPFLAKRGWSASLASIGATLSAMVIVIIPFLLIGVGIYTQVANIADEIGGDRLSTDSVLHYVDTMAKPLAERVGASQFSVVEYVKENRPQILQAIRQPAGKLAGQAGFTVLTLVIALLTMFFMLRDGHRLRKPALELLPMPHEKAAQMLQKVAETVRAVFIGTVLVACIQGAIMGVTYALIGVPNALLLGVFSVLLCIIPLLGAPVLYFPIGLVFLIQGDIRSASIVLLVGALVVSQIDNILKPIFIAGRANLHPLAVFFAILGGVLLVGPIGVMAGPMLLTVTLSVVEIIRESLPK